MLTITTLSKRYKTGDQALTEVSMTIPRGQVMCLIGPSGAGKSTLIRCINRLVEPTSGSITLDGVELTSMGGSELRRTRRRIGMIFQEHALVERLSVMENLLSGRLGYVGFWKSYFRRFPSDDIRNEPPPIKCAPFLARKSQIGCIYEETQSFPPYLHCRIQT